MIRLIRSRHALVLTAFFAALPGTRAQAQNKTATQLQAMFQARSFTSAEVTMVYRLYVPANYNPAQKYPIVVTLHGVGERGTNNTSALTAEELAQPWVRDSVQAKHPHFVMIPQCPTANNQYWWPWGSWAGTWNGMWSGTRSNANLGIVQILDSLKREFSLDTTRFYAAGLSMGGFGTFELMKWNPLLFAAAVPTAGGSDTADNTMLKMTLTPFWAFHGASDPTINVDRGSRAVVRKVGALGKSFVKFTSAANQANPTGISVDSLRKAVYVDHADFLYSEVNGGNHASGWLEAWRHPMLTDWVFSKRKVDGVTTSITPVAAARAASPAVRLVLAANGVLLEKKTADGRIFLHTLDGKRFPETKGPNP
jgi:predicted peptidase